MKTKQPKRQCRNCKCHQKSCEWKATENGQWGTSCCNCFEFTTDGPTENKFTHCPYCGRKIKEVK